MERDGYRLHAKLPVHQRRVARAIQRVQEATAAVPGCWAACVSGGKDSIALLDLMVAAGWSGPVFQMVYRETPMTNVSIVDAVAARYGLEVHRTTVTGAFDVFDRLGRFIDSPTTAEEKREVNKMNREYKEQASGYQESAGWSGIMMGLRSGESRARTHMLRKKGSLYTTLTRSQWTCCPLIDWDGRDVWARLVGQDLPWLARYDRSEDRDRERSEPTWLAVDCWRWGQGSDMKRSDPEAWAAMVERWPDLALTS